MIKNKIIAFLFIVMLLSCNTKKGIQPISFQDARTTLLKVEGPAEFKYWEFENSKQLWQSECGVISEINKYRDSLRLVLGEEKLGEAIAKEASQDLPVHLIEKEENGDRINALLVHTGALGKIRKINFLEAQILNHQLTKYPLFSQPTEFHGFIAVHEKDEKVRVYFAASDTEWPPNPQIVIEALEKEIQNGWRLENHLHNHYCKADQDYIGILAPSLADAQYFKMLLERFNLSKALITNGFHTVELENTTFSEFESH